MSTLTVLMPARDATVSPQAWQLPPLRYLLADRRGRTVRTGIAPLGLLPKAAATILLLAGRDVLLVDAVVPPLVGPRLRQALPNIIEDQLLSDGPPPHIALGPAAANARKSASRRTLAAIDRGWLRFMHEAFTAAGHRNLRAVPIVACLPMVSKEPVLPVTDSALAVESGVAGTRGGTAAQKAPQNAGADVGAGAGADTDSDAEAAANEATNAAIEAAERDEAHALASSATVLIVDGIDPLSPLMLVGAGGGEEDVFASAVVDADSGGRMEPGAGGAVDTDALLSRAGVRDSALQIELAIRRLPVPPLANKVLLAERFAGEGLVVPVDALVPTLDALLPGNGAYPTGLANLAGGEGSALKGREILRLVTGLNDVTSRNQAQRLDRALQGAGVVARPFTFEDLAATARTVDFDVCQFEFAAQPWRWRPGTVRQFRLPLLLLVASAVIAVVGINLHWAELARQRDAVQTQMTALLLQAFPRTTVVLDPAVQMTRSLEALRVSAGELSPNDFLTLTNGVALSLGVIPPTAIESIDYDRQTLSLTFRTSAHIDPGFGERLARNGLNGSFDGRRWAIRSAR